MASVMIEEGALEVHNRSEHLKGALGLGRGRQDSRKENSVCKDLEAKGAQHWKK